VLTSTALLAVPILSELPVPTDPRLLHLKQRALDGLDAANSKRNYAQALDHLFAFAAGRPVSPDLLLAWRAAMEKQSPSTVNIRLSAMRSLVTEACRADMLSQEDVARLTDMPNMKQAGSRKGNWLTRGKAKRSSPCRIARSLRESGIMSSFLSWSRAHFAGRS
jgi:hypothetical protein